MFLFALVLIASVLVGAIACRRKGFQLPHQRPLSSPDFKVSTTAKGERTDGSNTTPSWKPAIEPLADFDWRATPPTKLRPFKPIYHITMGKC